jgi:tetratricopeptide (TPR) repeat protein
LQGKFEEALEHYNKSLEIDIKVFETDEHAFIATTLQNIGSVLKLQGKYVEAFYCYKKSLKNRKKSI